MRVLWSWCLWCTQRAPLVKNCFLQGLGGKYICWIILSQLYIFSSIITSSRYMSWIENLTTCIENYVNFHFKTQTRELKLFEKVSRFFALSCTLLISNWKCFLSCTRIQKDTYQLPATWWKIKMSFRFLFDFYRRFLKTRVFEEVESFSRNIKDDGQIIPLTSSSLSFVKAFQPWCFDASDHCLLVLSSL